MICPECKNIYPAHYKKCIKCNAELVKEKFAPQDTEEQEVKELITPFVEFTPLDDFGALTNEI